MADNSFPLPFSRSLTPCSQLQIVYGAAQATVRCLHFVVHHIHLLLLKAISFVQHSDESETDVIKINVEMRLACIKKSCFLGI